MYVSAIVPQWRNIYLIISCLDDRGRIGHGVRRPANDAAGVRTGGRTLPSRHLELEDGHCHLPRDLILGGAEPLLRPGDLRSGAVDVEPGGRGDAADSGGAPDRRKAIRRA
jgi:hypothetical protein